MYDTSKIPEALWVPLHHLQCSSELREILGALIESSNNFDEGAGAIVSSALAKEAHDKARELYSTFKEMGVKAYFRYGSFDDKWGYVTLSTGNESSNIEIRSLEKWLEVIKGHNPGTSVKNMCIVID